MVVSSYAGQISDGPTRSVDFSTCLSPLTRTTAELRGCFCSTVQRSKTTNDCSRSYCDQSSFADRLNIVEAAEQDGLTKRFSAGHMLGIASKLPLDAILEALLVL